QDWLVKPINKKAAIFTSTDKKEVILDNGLVRRGFRLAPNVACIDYRNISTGQQLLRAIKPEARLVINGIEYNVGGLSGQKEKAYLLPEWVENFKTGDNDFQFVSYDISEIKPHIKWKAANWGMKNQQPAG